MHDVEGLEKRVIGRGRFRHAGHAGHQAVPVWFLPCQEVREDRSPQLRVFIGLEPYGEGQDSGDGEDAEVERDGDGGPT
jgi:hypothetical protein